VSKPLYHKITRPAPKVDKYLGELEAAIMTFLWARGAATVREVVEALAARRPIAYTTVMTVMQRLVAKGLLARSAAGRRHVYRPAVSRAAFLGAVSGRIVQELVADFGDVALAQFLRALDDVDPERLAALRRLAAEEER
jgi:predicted transcriptional regulator